MTTLSQHALSSAQSNHLIQADGEERLTIMMPTEKSGRETQQNPIRFKNLYQTARKCLEDREFETEEIDAFLDGAHLLLDDYEFWQHQGSGLAMFIDEAGIYLCQSPTTLPELVTVGPRFQVLPVLPLLTDRRPIYVLALSAGHSALFELEDAGLRPVTLENVPTSLEEAMVGVDEEKHLQFHSQTSRHSAKTGGGRPAIFHGHGGGGDDANAKVRLAEYAHMLDAGVVEALRGKRATLILAATEPLLSIYRHETKCNGVADEVIHGSPDPIDADALAASAVAIRDRMRLERGKKHAATYQAAAGHDRTTDDLNQVVLAAHDGKIDTLLVREGATAFGIFDAENRGIEVGQVANDMSGKEDLLNLAAIKTRRHSGLVHILPDDVMPTGSDAAALLRYAE